MQYYQPQQSQQTADTNSQDIELFFSCFNLADKDTVGGSSDPFLELYALNIDPITFQETTTLVGKTETIENKANAEFAETFSMEYQFQKSQRFQVKVYDCDGDKDKEIIGKANFELSQVVSTLQSGLVISIQDEGKETGKVKIRAAIEENSSFEYDIDFKCADVKDLEWMSKTDPYIIISRPATKHFQTRDFTNTVWVEEYTTEHFKDNLNPNFKPFKLKAGRLNKGNEQAPIQFKLMDHAEKGDCELVGTLTLTVAQILGGAREFTFIDNKNKSAGKLIFEKFEKQRSFQLTDYLKAGLSISLCACYDFSKGNGDVSSSSYLHKPDASGQNVYESATNALGKILASYDTDQQIPCYAFSFTAPSQNINTQNNCFPLNGNTAAPHIHTFQNIIPVYRNFATLAVPGNTCELAPLLNTAFSAFAGVFQTNKYLYNILVVIVAGKICDKVQVNDAMNNAKTLPVSVIIISVGNQADEEFLEGLDDAKKTGGRDMVQYVDYKDAMKRGDFGQEVLCEIPDQVIGFYKSIGVFPN